MARVEESGKGMEGAWKGHSSEASIGCVKLWPGSGQMACLPFPLFSAWGGVECFHPDCQ